MKHPWIIGLALVPLAAQAELITDRRFDHTVTDVDPSGFVEIDNIAGEIRITATNRATIEIEGRLGKNIEGVEITQGKSSTVIQVIYPEGRNYKSGAAYLDISLPRGSSVEAVGVSAEISADGIRGSQRLKSVSGEIRTEAFDADVRAVSVSGDVRVDGNNGSMDRVTLASVSGDVYGSGLAGEVEAESVSGDVEVFDSRVQRGNFSSTSGDLDLQIQLADGARLSFETVSGDIDLAIQGRADGRYDLSTFSGDLDNCFGPEHEKERGRGKRHRFVEGNSDYSRVEMNTMSGDIYLCTD